MYAQMDRQTENIMPPATFIGWAHTHPFNSPLSGTTQVSRYQKGKTNLDFTEARDSEWQWHLLGHMQVCTSLQTDNYASIPPLIFLQARCPSCRPTNSVKALKANLLDGQRHRNAGLPWGQNFYPHTHPIPTENPVGIPTGSPYPQNSKILHTHTRTIFSLQEAPYPYTWKSPYPLQPCRNVYNGCGKKLSNSSTKQVQ